MEKDNLTGKNNNVINKTSDESINAVLRDAQKQLNRSMDYDASNNSGKTEKKENVKISESYNKAEPANMPKVYPDASKDNDGKRLDILVKDIDDSVYVDDSVPTPIRKEGITFGDVFCGILEFIWTVFKLAVVVSVVTAVVGFFLSREMLIRGRNGNLKSLDDMTPSGIVLSTKDSAVDDAKEWMISAKPKKLTLESDDGHILVARKIVVNKDSDNWVVILHSYNGSMGDVYDIAKQYAERKYNVLMPDLRACGESEGSFIGMGWLDRLDVINWMDVIIEDNPSAHIVIHGVDMGADTALMLSGEPLKSNIKGIVAEGAYTSAWDVLKKEFKLRHEKWPVFPMMEMVNPVAKVWGGYSLKEASAVKQVEKTSVPILLIQGGQDTFATEEMASKLNESIASAHQLVEIPNGVHEYCRYADPDTYYNNVFDFVDSHIE